MDCHRTINTGRAVADGFAAGDAVTGDVNEVAALDEAGSLEPVGDEAVDDGAVNDGDGDGAVVDEPLVVAAALLGMTSLELASGVPQATTRQPTSTASEIIGHRHKLFTCITTLTVFASAIYTTRSTSHEHSANSTHRTTDRDCSTCGIRCTDGGPRRHGCIHIADFAAVLKQLSIAMHTPDVEGGFAGR